MPEAINNVSIEIAGPHSLLSELDESDILKKQEMSSALKKRIQEIKENKSHVHTYVENMHKLVKKIEKLNSKQGVAILMQEVRGYLDTAFSYADN